MSGEPLHILFIEHNGFPSHGINCRECHHQKRKVEEIAFIAKIRIRMSQK